MVKVIRSTIIEAPLERVWDVLRDFNGHDQWHPAIAYSAIERSEQPDRVGCVRRFKLQDGSELREKLLTLSDLEQSFSYCLIETPIPLLNYVSHVNLYPVTDGNATFWQWQSTFNTPVGQQEKLGEMVRTDIYDAGFEAIRSHLELEVRQ